LWRLSKGTQKGAAHLVTIAEPSLARHYVNRVAALLHEGPRRLHAEALDRFCRRLYGFGSKCAAKLPGTQVGRLSKLGHGKGRVEMLSRKSECLLNPIRLRCQFEESRELRLPTATPMIENELSSDGLRYLCSEVVFN
jgi:hypothetical protein